MVREAWELLEAFFVRRNLHNHIQLHRQLYEFKMTSDTSILDHLMKFDNLCLEMAAIGDALKNDEKLVILLGCLSSNYDNMVKVIKNNKELALVETKEMLRREYEAFQIQEQSEVALKVHRWSQAKKDQRGNEKKQPAKRFFGRCFGCGKVGHKQSKCRSGLSKRSDRQGDNNGEYVFAASIKTSDSWILDSCASSLMSNELDDFTEYRPLKTPITISVTDGAIVRAAGVGSIEVSITWSEAYDHRSTLCA